MRGGIERGGGAAWSDGPSPPLFLPGEIHHARFISSEERKAGHDTLHFLYRGGCQLGRQRGDGCRYRTYFEGTRPQGRHSEARSVFERRSWHHESVSAWGGFRHGGRGWNRTRPRPLMT